LEYHAYVLLPYIAENASASIYTPSKGDIQIEVNFANFIEYGASIANATFSLSEPEPISEIRMYITFHRCSDLEATRYPLGWNFLGSTRAVILTFFGPRGKLGWPENVSKFTGRGLNTILAIGSPLFVHFKLPSGMRFSSSESFPTTMQNYEREEQKWVMFSPVFPQDNLAQTIGCYFDDPTAIQSRSILVFGSGLVFGVGVSLIVNWIEEKIRKEKKRTKRTRANEVLIFHEFIVRHFDKAYEDFPLKILLDAPVHTISGISEVDAHDLKKALGVYSVKDLATNKHIMLAQAINSLSTLSGKTLDKKLELHEFRELREKPVSSMIGISKADATLLKKAFGIRTVAQLAENKYVQIAQTLHRFDALIAHADA